ncbi:MAG: hypothetical protein P4L10_08810 [Acidobacteriaceae bacterium]|nr:hypothetical protein [Acidobacteriaceae bacterium]
MVNFAVSMDKLAAHPRCLISPFAVAAGAILELEGGTPSPYRNAKYPVCSYLANSVAAKYFKTRYLRVNISFHRGYGKDFAGDSGRITASILQD